VDYAPLLNALAYWGSFASKYECNASLPMSLSANSELPPVNRFMASPIAGVIAQ
jgi:hypothetical protein